MIPLFHCEDSRSTGSFAEFMEELGHLVGRKKREKYIVGSVEELSRGITIGWGIFTFRDLGV